MSISFRALCCKAAIALGAAALAGCATQVAKTPEQEVAERAETRWQHLIKGDFTGAYGYLMPSFRALVSEQSYRQRFGSAGAWTNAIIHQVKCEPNACDVRVRVTTQVRVPQFARHIPEVNAYLDERWVREGGQWWLYQKL